MDVSDDRRGIGDLLGDLGRQVSTLVRKEIDLARVEVTSSLARAGRGAAVAGSGALLLYAGMLVLLAALVLGLIDAGWDPWLAALAVGGVVMVLGAIVTTLGARQVQTTDLAPRHTADTVRENVEFVKESIK